MEQLRREHERLEEKANLSKGIQDVQAIINQLKNTEGVVEGSESTWPTSRSPLRTTLSARDCRPFPSR